LAKVYNSSGCDFFSSSFINSCDEADDSEELSLLFGVSFLPTSLFSTDLII